ncbi:MAG: sodium:solute symporter [Flavobacteriales bacterium]
MSPWLILGIFLAYFGVLTLISRASSGKGDNKAFFLGNRESPWYLVAFGMIGTSLSGVTFISVPGEVQDAHFTYMQVVFGYFFGYLVIAFILMPLYYRMGLTSIYTYLEKRFGKSAYKVGSFYFLLSRTIGAAFRLYLIASVLQLFVFDGWGVPFEVTVLLSILFIWLYTARGGIRTLIRTDAFQTFFMLLAVVLSLYKIGDVMGWGITEIPAEIGASRYSHMFNFKNILADDHFLKHFLGGMFITITMTGLDQDMMQKNLSCPTLRDAQKNMLSFSAILIVVNLIFLGLGAALYLYADGTELQVPERSDHLYPTIAMDSGLGIGLGVTFLLGLVAAAYSSADSALTALTTAFSIDFLRVDRCNEKKAQRLRRGTHVLMSFLLLGIILIFHYYSKESVIEELLTASTYTYGPLLGLFAFGIFLRRQPFDALIPVMAVLAPIMTWVVAQHSKEWLGGYVFGYEKLLLNGLLMLLGLLAISKPASQMGEDQEEGTG